jgi:serine/threonine protein kinase
MVNKKSESTDFPSEENSKSKFENKLSLNRIQNKNEFIKGKLMGSGRFGSVSSGLSANTGEIVAIKIYKVGSDIRKYAFKLEQAIQKLTNLNHQNLIKMIPCSNITDSFNENLEVTLIYEFCNGSSVKALLEKYGEFDEKLIKKYTKELLEGIKYLHSQNIVHRNIKSSNILVDGNGTIRISDILIESVLMGEGEEIREYLKSLSEIPYWISPEIIGTEEYIISDFWSIGCLIIEMATRKSPWAHYSFKNSTEFVNFIFSTNLIPPLPKKLSKSCHNFLNLLFNRPNKSNNFYVVTVDELLNHEFFTNIPDSVKESQVNLRKVTMDSQNLVSHNSSQVIANNNNLVNILHHPNEEAHLFSVTMTINSGSASVYLPSQGNEVTNIFNDNCRDKKILIPQNILEEIDASQENSPEMKKEEVFDFNSESENSYNYIHEANKSILRQAVTVEEQDGKLKCTSVEEFNKYNNIIFGEITKEFSIV